MIGILCYDICDAKRLQKMHRLACGYGVPMQYSVFLIQLSQAQLTQLAKDIENTIDNKEDNVKIYPIKHIPKEYLSDIGVTVTTDGLILT
ncbi:CRISPR-associated endonuclease Cas2 [Vibrio breoganii]|uniref:CRISPR-associated endoribonuclease Cas2 n=2 Tax=Vibrio breoganii TaxID=553239 RepID=A0AAP8SVS1_9VIBR|nr:CRISPR-associated endonuclease Cas2 [Vibrio breoganii]NMO74621.1 CRISPR-associated endonuclease Cas2 [Vibrio breoganii]NMR69933.1 CRISPR-associated endonuclease Cas2 [Vibrio breoganii]PMG06757.1 CRISPR-associated endonuclease Cas2 [Vibrio breoganii]PMH15926.1 CRISPR-associated endonuclease Cas2 [Vibrio breoganii]PML89794.1 CRISPR-associated endonuclease Cas2 [Vibrio breoganii]